MEFYISSGVKNYYVSFNHGNVLTIWYDEEIAKLLDMEINEYRKLARSYGTFRDGDEMFFPNKFSIQKFVNHLNNKYLIIMKLNGKF